MLLLFAISRYFTKQDYRSKGGAPFILCKSDIEKIYNAIYDNSISLKDYGLDDDDKVIIKEAFNDIEETIVNDIKTKRNLGILANSLNSLKDRHEQLKSLEQKADEVYNKRLETNTLSALRDKYTTTKQNEDEASEFHNKNQLKTALDAWREAKVNKETDIINEANEGIEYESRECHIHKNVINFSSELDVSPSDNNQREVDEANENTSKLSQSLSFDSQDINNYQEVKQPTINPVNSTEQQTEDAKNENPVNEERANEEKGIAEVPKNETINNDDNNEEQNNQMTQQNNEEPMNTTEKLLKETEDSSFSVDNISATDFLGGRGLSIYNYGFLEAYTHFKRIEGVRLIEGINRMYKGMLRITCLEGYILDIIPVKQQFVIPFDWRRKEGIKKTSICTSFDIYRAKDRASVEWCIYKDVNGNKDFETYLNTLQNQKPKSSKF